MNRPASPSPPVATEPRPEPPARRTRHLLHVAQGLLMGAADVIPGVSGGTVALVVGIYERLVEAIRGVTDVPLATVRRGVQGLRAALADIEWGFIIPLGVGILTAFVVGARVLPPLMEAFPEESRALFFGLVAASLIVPWQRAGVVRGKGYALALAAATLAFLLVGLPVVEAVDPNLVRIFLSAAVAICAMILPGVSGAFLLVVLGIYAPTLEAIRSADLVYIFVFGMGAVTGLALFARLLGYLLARHHSGTMVVLVGLLAGSLRALWPWQGEVLIGDEWMSTPALLQGPPSTAAAVAAVAAAAIGFAVVGLLIWLGNRRERLPTRPPS